MLKKLIILALLSGCGNEGISAYAPSGVVWKLVEMQGQNLSVPVTLEMDGTRVSGRGPCNSYRAEQTVPAPWFELGGIVSTKRACPELALEQRYFQTLRDARVAEVSADELVLSDAQNGALLRFEPMRP